MLQKISQGDLWQYGPLYVSGDFNFITVFLFFLCFSVGPKISEMSPSAKDKIREDVQDAMAEKKDGKWQKFFMSFTCLKHDCFFNQKTGKLLLIAVEEESPQVNDLG